MCTSSSSLVPFRDLFKKNIMIEKWKHTRSLYLSCQCVYLVSYSYRQNAAAALTRIEYKNSFFYFRAMIEKQNCNEHKDE